MHVFSSSFDHFLYIFTLVAPFSGSHFPSSESHSLNFSPSLRIYDNSEGCSHIVTPAVCSIGRHMRLGDINMAHKTKSSHNILRREKKRDEKQKLGSACNICKNSLADATGNQNMHWCPAMWLPVSTFYSMMDSAATASAADCAAICCSSAWCRLADAAAAAPWICAAAAAWRDEVIGGGRDGYWGKWYERKNTTVARDKCERQAAM